PLASPDRDDLRWLLGGVRTVAASTSHAALCLDVEDTADVILGFESGVTGTVHVDYVQRPPSHWLRLTGDLGTILWDDADGAVRVWHVETRQWETIAPPAGFERNTMFLAEMRHFLDCVEEKVEPRVTLTDGVRALQIALAAKRAAESRTIEVSRGSPARDGLRHGRARGGGDGRRRSAGPGIRPGARRGRRSRRGCRHRWR